MAKLPHDDIYHLARDPVDMAALPRHVRAPEDGAMVIFDGFVRNQSHNRPTLYLDYEAYESMALAKMREIGAQLHEKYRIHRVSVVHRLGRLEVGETDRKSTRLNSSHSQISYAVFCLKKKKQIELVRRLFISMYHGYTPH